MIAGESDARTQRFLAAACARGETRACELLRAGRAMLALVWPGSKRCVDETQTCTLTVHAGVASCPADPLFELPRYPELFCSAVYIGGDPARVLTAAHCLANKDACDLQRIVVVRGLTEIDPPLQHVPAGQWRHIKAGSVRILAAENAGDIASFELSGEIGADPLRLRSDAVGQAGTAAYQMSFGKRLPLLTNYRDAHTAPARVVMDGSKPEWLLADSDSFHASSGGALVDAQMRLIGIVSGHVNPGFDNEALDCSPPTHYPAGTLITRFGAIAQVCAELRRTRT